ncbi:diguanylate cyclase with PAS/PAC and GAF sensors [Anabaenopsis circularis NIES-21]|uniref:Diguanylate cyclase with PAS/PAC and GAF sensors n=1 Tax=Anabaenopsis circularis NIES-21 TaxID=1085406 RepID=A0A1Z4GBX3_9CYAN|nr:diguanylate cyclase with PAS/PAC and GAF sensors [Anabaenopsis circularis NIES-21]
MHVKHILDTKIELKQILQQIRKLNVRIHQSLDLDEILNIVVSEARKTLKSDRVIIYRFLHNGDGAIAEESVSHAWQPILGQLIYDPCFQAAWVEKYQNGWVSVIEDINTKQLHPCYKKLLESLQIRANLVVPILLNNLEIEKNSNSSSQLWGLLIANHCGSSHQWNALEIEYLRLVAAELGTAIWQTQCHQRLKSLTVQPKLKSKPIKVALHKNSQASNTTEPALPKHISVADLTAFERLQTPVWIYDIEKLQMWWANSAAFHIWNTQSREELLSRNFGDVSKSTRIRLQNYLQQFQQGKTIAENWTFYPEGKPVWVRCLCSGIEIKPGRMAMLVEGSTEAVNHIDKETLRSIEALRHTTVMISLYTMDGVLLMQNPAASRCYGDNLHPNSSTENVFLSHFVDKHVGQQAMEAIKLGEVFSIETQVFTNEGIRSHGIDIRCTRDPITGNSLILVNEKDITKQQTALEEHQRAEDELRWQEALLRSMTDTSLLGFFVVDNRTDKILYFNHRFCEIWGIEHLETQMRFGALKNNEIIPDCIPLIADLPAFIESCKPLQSEENRAIVEDEILFVDGRTIRRFSSQIRDHQDKYFGRLYIFEDISDRKKLETVLRESEQRYRSVIAAMAEGIVLQQADGSITACNESAERILGLTAQQMMGRTSIDPRWQTIHEDGSAFPGETHPAIVTLRTGQPQFNIGMGVHKPDGSLSWISINSQPLIQPDESTPYAVVATFADITARKQAELALQQQTQRESMIAAIALRIRQSLDIDKILNTTVAEVRDFLQSDRVIIYRCNPDGSDTVVTKSVAENCHVQLLEVLPAKAKLVVSILQGDRLWGKLVSDHCSTPRQWQPWESELLHQLATQVAIAIQQSELYYQLQIANQQLENIAMIDQLTQIANRRCFDRKLESVWQYISQQQGCVSLLLCDIDYFKQYNDTYGHAAGDDCLRLVAGALQQTVKRSTDLAARYGGEEFVVILPNTDSDGAILVAQEIHQAIAQLNIPHAASAVKPHITLSIGIATIIPTLDTVTLELIEAADQALYQAKAQGRDRSCINS